VVGGPRAHGLSPNRVHQLSRNGRLSVRESRCRRRLFCRQKTRSLRGRPGQIAGDVRNGRRMIGGRRGTRARLPQRRRRNHRAPPRRPHNHRGRIAGGALTSAGHNPRRPPRHRSQRRNRRAPPSRPHNHRGRIAGGVLTSDVGHNRRRLPRSRSQRRSHHARQSRQSNRRGAIVGDASSRHRTRRHRSLQLSRRRRLSPHHQSASGPHAQIAETGTLRTTIRGGAGTRGSAVTRKQQAHRGTSYGALVCTAVVATGTILF